MFVALLASALAAHETNVTVHLHGLHSTTADIINPSFVGLSIEVPGVLKMIGENGTNAALGQLLRNLYHTTLGAHAGPVLRLGGNSADGSCYASDISGQQLPAKCKYAITAKDLAAYKTFALQTAKDCNISYVIDTNFGLSPDPRTVALAHVQAITKSDLWPLVSAIEIGNEVDIYAKSDPSQQEAKGDPAK